MHGSIGDTLPSTKKASSGQFASINDYIAEINPQRAGTFAGKPESMWLENSLESVSNIQKARLIFQATQLPNVRATPPAAHGAAISLIPFGTGQNQWQIDHLIPQNSFPKRGGSSILPSEGDPYETTLRNLCPIQGTDNGAFKATDCANKLDTNASKLVTYSSDPQKHVGGLPVSVVADLLSLQGSPGGNASLNDRKYLVKDDASGRCYGKERIILLRDDLLEKI